MRCAILISWASFAVALGAAVIGDACTEWLANRAASGTLGIDVHHESLLPTAVFALAVIASLAVRVASARAHADDSFARSLRSPGARALFLVATGVLTLAIVVAMEGYETRFGGLSAFDPRSLLASHLVPVIAAYAFVACGVERLLHLCLRVASHAWLAVTNVFGSFVRRRTRAVATVMESRRHPYLRITDTGCVGRAHALRAPPASMLQVVACIRRRFTWFGHSCERWRSRSSSPVSSFIRVAA